MVRKLLPGECRAGRLGGLAPPVRYVLVAVWNALVGVPGVDMLLATSVRHAGSELRAATAPLCIDTLAGHAFAGFADVYWR